MGLLGVGRSSFEQEEVDDYDCRGGQGDGRTMRLGQCQSTQVTPLLSRKGEFEWQHHLEMRSGDFFIHLPIPSPPILLSLARMEVGLVTLLQLLCEQFMPLQLPSQSFVCCTLRKGKN